MSNSEEMWKVVWSPLKESVRALKSQRSDQKKNLAGIVRKVLSVMNEKKSSSGNATATPGEEDFAIVCLLDMLDDDGKTPLSYANPKMRSFIKKEGIWVWVGNQREWPMAPPRTAFDRSPD